MTEDCAKGILNAKQVLILITYHPCENSCMGEVEVSSEKTNIDWRIGAYSMWDLYKLPTLRSTSSDL